jgi:hypothetical protein
MSQSVKGNLKVKGETKEFGSNGFTKREIVVTVQDKYPQHILIELIKDKCSIIDQYNIEDEIEVSYNLLGREWVSPKGETKYFNSLQGWKIEGVTQAKQEDNFPDDEVEMPWDKK